MDVTRTWETDVTSTMANVTWTESNTTGSLITAKPEDGLGFDTRLLIISVGALGVASNGFCMIVICGYPRLRRRRRSVLIVNQTVIDLMTSLLLAAYEG